MNRLTFKKKKDGDNDHDDNNNSSSNNNGDFVEYDEKDDNHVLIFQKVSNQYLFLFLKNNYYHTVRYQRFNNFSPLFYYR